jgi:hypothetical protein
MPTTLETAAESCSRAKTLSGATRNEYLGPQEVGEVADAVARFEADPIIRF